MIFIDCPFDGIIFHFTPSAFMEVFSENLNTNNEVKSGDFLLAEPMLLDPNFQRTVVIICEHKDEEGSFGLIVNREADVQIEQLEDFLYLKR